MKTRGIWGEVGVANWKAIINQVGGEVQSSSDVSLKAKCPWPDHRESSPSFFIRTDKGFSKCHGCGTYYSDPIKFISALMKLTWGAALIFLRQHGCKSIPAKLALELAEQEKLADTRSEVAFVCNTALCKAIDAPEDNLWAKKLLDFLKKRNIII